MINERVFAELGTPQSALGYLRHLTEMSDGEVITWELMQTVAFLNFEGLVPKLKIHFRTKNSTGLAELFREAADKLTGEIFDSLTSSDQGTVKNGMGHAHLIVLLRKCAEALRCLHGREAIFFSFA